MRTGLLASTVTPGRTAPVVSLTLPAMELWARAAAGSNTTKANAMNSDVATTFVRILGLRETNDDRLILTARGESLAAFDGRCIPAGCVAPRSNTPGILGRRALPAGRLARLGATPAFHHRLLREREA